LTDFNKLFQKKERHELQGKKFMNLFILVGILFITFIALGFANGSLIYLNKKMSDPFIQWVNIEIPEHKTDIFTAINDDLNNTSNKDKYYYSDVFAYYELRFYLRLSTDSRGIRYKGRSIEPENPVYKFIIDDDNYVTGKKTLQENDIGLIITEAMYHDLGYSNAPAYIYYEFSNNEMIVPLPVVTVVKDLPGNAKFACTPFLYLKLRDIVNYPFDIAEKEYKQQLIYFIPDAYIEKFQQDIGNLLNESELESIIDELYIRDFEHESHLSGSKLEIRFTQDTNTALKIKQVELVDSLVRSNGLLSKYNVTRIYDYYLEQSSPFGKEYESFAVFFEDFKNIRSFRTYIYKAFGLDIDMNQIQSKENYGYVSSLTKIISGFLILFCIITIIIYLTNLLQRHLEKIKKNLGTFKAFGLEDRNLSQIYSRIILIFVSLSILISLFISSIIGYLGFFKLLLPLFDIQVEAKELYFNLHSRINVYLSIVLVLLLSYLFSKRKLKSILSKSPGELIYDRNNTPKK
jgi:hypothetical protein